MEDMEQRRYPIGRFHFDPEVTAEKRRACLDELRALPERLRLATAGLSDEQLDTPYREGGWTVRQIVHHLPDSHVIAYVRTRLALTEDQPMVQPYDRARWADLPDASNAPAEDSLLLVDALHRRWLRLLEALTPEDFARTFRQPERGVVSLDEHLQVCAWHARHHIAHIQELRRRMGW